MSRRESASAQDDGSEEFEPNRGEKRKRSRPKSTTAKPGLQQPAQKRQRVSSSPNTPSMHTPSMNTPSANFDTPGTQLMQPDDMQDIDAAL